MSKTLLISRAVSLLVVISYTSLASWHRSSPSVALIVFILCFGPLALIWFPRVWSGYTGGWGSYTLGLGHGNNYATTPPFLLSIMGWFLLFLLGGLYLIAAYWKVLSN